MDVVMNARPGEIGVVCAEVLRFNGLVFLQLGSMVDPSKVRALGYFRLALRGIYLYKLDGSVEAFLVRDDLRREYFVVTAYQRKEGIMHMFSTTTLTERWLQTQGLRGIDEFEAVRGACVELLVAVEGEAL